MNSLRTSLWRHAVCSHQLEDEAVLCDVPDPTRTHKGARGQQNWSEPVMHRQDPGIDGTSKELGKLRSVGGLELGGEDGWGAGRGWGGRGLQPTRSLGDTDIKWHLLIS